MFGSEIIRTMIRPFLVFVALMVGVSALLQDTLFVYKLAGSHAHWAIILLGLPILIGIVLRYLGTAQPLLIIIAGAVASTVGMYFLYKTYFWAQAPTLMNGLFLCAVIAGGAHLPYSRGPIERFFYRIQSVLKSQKKKPRSKTKTTSKTTTKTKKPKQPSILKVIFAHENTIPMIEMTVGIASLVLSVYSIAFMGKG